MRTEGTDNNAHSHIMGKTLKARLRTIILVLVCFAVYCCPVYAADLTSPTTLEIQSARVFRSVAEADDFLLIMMYDIYYASSQPSYYAGDVFHFKLMSPDGDDLLGTSTPYPYQNNGYDLGLVGFYFDAASAPQWDDFYTLTIAGNPLYFSSVPTTNYALTSTNYSVATTMADNQAALGDHILDIAGELEINWGVETVMNASGKLWLNSTGEAYITGSIAGIKNMAPDIFLSASSKPDYDETDWGTGQADDYHNRYTGTWVDRSLHGLGDFLGVSGQIATSMVMLIVIILVFAWCQIKVHSTSPAIVAATPILLCSFIMGFISPSIMAVTIFFSIIFIGYILVFRNG